MQRGRLQVYLGMAPGVGKTYTMLADAAQLAASGTDAVVGLAETHGRPDTDALLTDLEQIPPRRLVYHGSTFDELDLDAILARRPDTVLVDELAHTCVSGSRHTKRWEDVEELLDAGINVTTCLNVAHIDSLAGAVETITGISPQETVPDAVLAAADRIDLIDITPATLRARITESHMMHANASDRALAGYFTAERLTALRRLADQWLTDHHQAHADTPATPPTPTTQRVVVALTGDPEGEHVLRRAAHIAQSPRGELIGVHVREPSGLTQDEPAWLTGQRRLLTELGGRYNELAGIDVATAILDFARDQDAHQLVLGATRRSHYEELMHGSVINKAIRTAGQVEVHVIPRRTTAHTTPRLPRIPSIHPIPLPPLRRRTAWVAALAAPVVLTLILTPFRHSLGLTGALLFDLLAIIAAALLGGTLPALLATLAAVLLSDYYFTVPLHTLRVGNAVDVVALITFAIVAAAVGGLVDLLTRQGVQAARIKAEADNLARLTAQTLTRPRELADTVESVRRAFHLDTVAILRHHDTGWQIESLAGAHPPQDPAHADHQIQIDTDRVLTINSNATTPHDGDPLTAFLTELRLARERTALDTLHEHAAGRPQSGH